MQRFLVVYHGILPLLFFILECVYQETDTRDACHITHVIGEGCEGGVLIPFRRKLFFSNTSSNPTIPACVAQIEIPFPIFLLFFFQESQYQCTKSHFPASTKGKSQFPFYPFTTLIGNTLANVHHQCSCSIFSMEWCKMRYETVLLLSCIEHEFSLYFQHCHCPFSYPSSGHSGL